MTPVARLCRAFTPDDFAGDWYGWLTNQAAHAGIVGAWLGLAWLAVLPQWYACPAAVATYWLAWEWRQARKGWADSIEDTGHVGFGALLHCALYVPETYLLAVALMGIWSGALVLGIKVRQ